MTTTPEPVTAADLAEALREAVKEQRWDAGECRECYGAGEYWDEEQDREVSCPQCQGTGIAGDAALRWQALLDRYDAQQRAYLEQGIRLSEGQRDRWMAWARLNRRFGCPITSEVRQARNENWQIVRSRRELRKLER